MKVAPITLAIWLAYGTLRKETAAAYRMMRLKRKMDGKEAWATVLPDVWGRWNA